MKIINLTPHPLTLVGENGTVIVPKGDQVARLAVTRTALPAIVIDGISLAVNIPTMGDIDGLPNPQDGVIYVTSALVADAARRTDVYSPGDLLRDTAGNIIGAKGLCAYAPKGGAA